MIVRLRPMMAVLAAVIGILTAAPAGAAWNLWVAAPIVGPVVFPTLVPGSQVGSSWAATAVPPQQGDSTALGYNEPVNAGWDTPQFMEVYTPNTALPDLPQVQKVCVDAWHISGAGLYSGIQKVTFILNNGTPADVPVPQVTAEAGDLEYCANINIAGFTADTQTEVRAIAYPVSGQPVVLQGGVTSGAMLTPQSSLFGFAAVNGPTAIKYVGITGASDSNNSCGSASTPCATVARAAAVLGPYNQPNLTPGAIICAIENGSYNGAPNSDKLQDQRWLTTRSCPPATRSGVVFDVSAGTSHLNKYRVYQASITGLFGGASSTSGIKAYQMIDHVTAVAQGVPGTASASSGSVINTAISNDATKNIGGFMVDSSVSGYTQGGNNLILARGNTTNLTNDDLWSGTLWSVGNISTNGATRLASGPYAISSISSDGKTITIPKVADGTLYIGDCLQDPNESQTVFSQQTCVGSTESLKVIVNGVDQSNPGSTALSLNIAVTGSPTSFIQKSENHADVWQFAQTAPSPVGIALYNNTILQKFMGQTVFWENGATNAAVVDDRFDNTAFLGALSAQQQSVNIGQAIKNVLFQGNSHAGGVRNSGGLTSATDWVERNDTCTSSRLGSIVPTYVNSASCQ